ncbi:FAD/NAD(P)-binding protein [Streptomyces sp. MUSC 125]|uniref:FAD/NAD(P)-binding protein n=1 Tax=Streptomyces sp. MUSC 125 TaxID=1428624 RepID=UPI0007C68BD3|nr:FAD/NAD(P)-binding protein [Streptomyces sp. MUSC 125]
MNTRHAQIGIVGAGPRGLSVLERICAQERKSPSRDRITVHVIDPTPPGPGRVWRTDQSRHLLMNTVACQVSVFTDASLAIDGPIEEGPSLYEWLQCQLRGDLDEQGLLLTEEGLAEARALGPDSYPTRAIYGHYLQWVFGRLVETAPAHVEIRTHRAEAVALDDASAMAPEGADGGAPAQQLTLSNGTVIGGLDAVILAQGHLPAQLTPTEAELTAFAEANGLQYLPPANPADVDVDRIPPGETVILRGMGLNFFDYMALFTAGRGGSFERDIEGRLVYHPSGREPRIFTGSRRGIPYHSRGENEKGPHGRYWPRLLTAEKAAEFRARAESGDWVRFGTDLWPMISAEVESVYYAALLTGRGADGDAFAERYLAAQPGAERADLLVEAGIASEDHWDWERISRPYGDREFPDSDSYRAWLLDHLRADVVHARAGNVSGPLKAALDVMRDLRNEIRLAVDHRGLEGNSHRDDLDGWYTPLNAFVSIGPPVSRTAELIALIEAGIVEVAAPGLRVEAVTDDQGPAFAAWSTVLPDQRCTAATLVEARLPEPDLRRTADPLLRHLLDSGQCAPYRLSGECGTSYETGGLDVTERPYRIVDAAGRPHPRRFAYGVPTESVHWITAAGIRPGVGSVTLEDSDAIAAAALATEPALPEAAASTATSQSVQPEHMGCGQHGERMHHCDHSEFPGPIGRPAHWGAHR